MPTHTSHAERVDVAPAEALRRSSTALLTTYRRDGRPVATPVSVAIHGVRVYFVTAADSGKARRLARRAEVTLAPCTLRGEPLGPAVQGRPTGPGQFAVAVAAPAADGRAVRELADVPPAGHRMVLFEVDLPCD